MCWFQFLSYIVFYYSILFYSKSEGLNDNYRLPKTIRPLKYNLTIEPILVRKPIFTGTVSIEILVFENTDNITLNVRELDINTSTISTVNKHDGINIINTMIDEEKQFYIMKLNRTLATNTRYELKINFSGNLSFDNVGFYLAKYSDIKGNERILAVTDLQPNGARKVFPCFDEPEFKANFVINIIRSKNHISVSNEQLDFTKYVGNDRFQDTYKETVKMSTYLVAFTVSDYNFTSLGRHRIFTTQEALESKKVDYVISISERIMTMLENFTDFNYTFSKVDEFSLPSKYFIPLAMENWGLITISEKNLFCYNSTLTTSYQLQACTLLTTHEFSHQWFGNLVTPLWWNYLWLSEGLATYLEYYITSTMLPSWRLMDQFIIQIQEKALQYDGNDIQKALNSNIDSLGSSPSSLISYYKGACIIRMVKHLLTDDIFKKGIRIYLQKHQFGNVVPLHLYQALQEALNGSDMYHVLNNFTVTDVLSTWDSSPGYPLVNAYRDYLNGSVVLLQNSFFPHNILASGHIWYIPISFILQSNNSNSNRTTPDYWLTEKFVTIDQFTPDGWIIVNKMQTGYYRVNYDIINWERLSTFLYNNEDYIIIPAINRAQLIDDAFALATWSYIPYEIPLNLSKYLVKETDYLPLASFLQNIERLNTVLIFTNIYNNFQNYIIFLLNGAYNYLGFDESVTDSHIDKLNRINIVTWLCGMGHEECRMIALKKFREWKSNAEIVLSADMQVPIFCGSMQAGTVEDSNFLYAKYESSKETDQKTRILTGLGCARNDVSLTKFLDTIFAVNSTLTFHIKKAAFEKLVQWNLEGIKVSLDYLINNISKIELTDSRFLAKFIEILCKCLTPSQILEHMGKVGSDIGKNTVISKCLIYATKTQAWISRGYVEEISRWLLDYKHHYLR